MAQVHVIERMGLLQGGANAGHTIYDSEGNKYKLHLVPSGILNQNAQCVVGNGVVIHLPSLFEEIATLKEQGVSTEGRLVVSDRAHLLFDLHKVRRSAQAQVIKFCCATFSFHFQQAPVYIKAKNSTWLAPVAALIFCMFLLVWQRACTQYCDPASAQLLRWGADACAGD
jgi:hypothetical protein